MSQLKEVQIKLIHDAVMPSYAKQGDAGADLRSRIDAVIYPGERLLIPTGVYVAIPEGYVGLIHPRSGLALNHGITVLNTPGTIDAGYRGELGVVLLNTDKYKSFEVSKGDRIAQLVIQSVECVTFHLVDELDATDRGVDGFGSTGV